MSNYFHSVTVKQKKPTESFVSGVFKKRSSIYDLVQHIQQQHLISVLEAQPKLLPALFWSFYPLSPSPLPLSPALYLPPPPDLNLSPSNSAAHTT